MNIHDYIASLPPTDKKTFKADRSVRRIRRAPGPGNPSRSQVATRAQRRTSIRRVEKAERAMSGPLEFSASQWPTVLARLAELDDDQGLGWRSVKGVDPSSLLGTSAPSAPPKK